LVNSLAKNFKTKASLVLRSMWKKSFMQVSFRKSDFFTVSFVLAIAGLFVLPVPPFVIDFLLVGNLTFAFLLVLVGLYLPSVLSLLSFPALLLLAALFRLGLNVATTRLILTQANAGHVVEAFGSVLIRDQVVVGLIIFSVITIVNFFVISKGATRVAEVAARFALEAIPGRQMTIESDLRAGLISPEMAQDKRDELRKESQLFAAMDGAMNFVQGDAIAGIVIFFVNIIGGLYIGVSQGLSVLDAVTTYTRLSVGDGLVSQIPAILNAICAGVVVTRVARGTPLTLGEEVGIELFSRPLPIIGAGSLIILLGCISALPTLPFFIVGSAVIIGPLYKFLKFKGDNGEENARTTPSYTNSIEIGTSETKFLPLLLGGKEDNGGEIEGIPEGRYVSVLLDNESLFQIYKVNHDRYILWWKLLQEEVRQALGIELPPLMVIAEQIGLSGRYKFLVDGTLVDEGFLDSANMLVELVPEQASLFGIYVDRYEECPFTGARIFWTPRSVASMKIFEAAAIRTFDFMEFILLKVACFFSRHPEEAVSIADTHHLLKMLDKRFPGLVNEALNKNLVDVSRLTEIAQELVRDGLGIRDFKQVVEVVSAYCSHHRTMLSNGEEFDRNHLISFVRVQRKRHLLRAFLSHRRSLKVFTLSSEVEAVFEQVPVESPFVPLAIEPETLEKLLISLRRILEPVRTIGLLPVSILCSNEIRSRVSTFLRGTDSIFQAISFDELDPSLEIEQIGTWKI
jgi:type III secretion protein V